MLEKKISVVGTVGLPACYGGWETLVENLVNNKSKDVSYEVYCSSKNYVEKIAKYNEARLIYIPLSANGISSILYDILSLIHCWFKKPDVVLVLGVSGCIFLPVFRLFSSSKLIVNIDGVEWKRDKWNSLAKWFLKLSEKFAINYSDVVVSDNIGISEYVNSQYGINSEVIAYGGDHALCMDRSGVILDYFFTVCRIEPENNIDMILDAFSKVASNLKIVGNWNSSDYGIELKRKYSSYSNIELIDPVYDINSLFEFRDKCKGYIHGHSVGGTNPSLVEIMHFGKHIYAYDCIYNRFTTEENAYFFDTSEKLQSLLKISDETDVSLSENVKKVADDRYTWDVITKQYESLYNE